jgi:hypothetical protein
VNYVKLSTVKLSTVKPAPPDASASSRNGPNPLWIITAALALFFAVAAAFLAAG